MEKPVYIELAVRVSDDSYESSLRIPVDSTPEQREAAAKMWINAMANALNMPRGDADDDVQHF